MLSLLGTALLCSSVLGFGFSYVTSIKNTREVLEELCSLLQRIETRIKCFKQPLFDIYEGFSSPYLDKIGFNDTLKESGLSFALNKHRTKLGLSTETFDLLCEFASSLGKSLSESQLKLCSFYGERLTELLHTQTQNEGQKTKLALTLSCAGACLSALMLL